MTIEYWYHYGAVVLWLKEKHTQFVGTVDLKYETIKKGSPHLLKITKTQAAFEKKLKNWKEDLSLIHI